MEDRRGFLKTLGKLAAAVGITAAVSATAGDTSGTTPSAKIENRASLENTSTRQIRNPIHMVSNSHITSRKMDSIEPKFGFTWDSAKTNPAEDIQRMANELTVARYDNASMMMNPPIFVPAHVRDFLLRRETIRNLDPYNWGAVFDLEWEDWRKIEPQFATATGRWIARVNPQFYGLFAGEVFFRTQQIALDYLESHVADPEVVKNYAKEQCYRALVDELQDLILDVIKRDVKANS